MFTNTSETEKILSKWGYPGPRFTVYPLKKHWERNVISENFIKEWEDVNEVNVYVHIPFCQSLCTFCACNTFITREKKYEDKYVSSLIKEWEYYRPGLSSKMKNFYFGGGTPHYVSLQNLEKLLSQFSGEGSFEIDPRHISEEYIDVLVQGGVSKFIVGIQDFDEEVLKNVRRETSFNRTLKVLDWINKRGGKLTLEFIHGLPGQNLNTLEKNIKILEDLPWENFVSYPCYNGPVQDKWQRGLGKNKFLNQSQKMELFSYLLKEAKLKNWNYKGLHTFSRVNKKDIRSWENTLGLGVSSISQTNNFVTQNVVYFDQYVSALGSGRLPIKQFHRMTTNEKIFGKELLKFLQGKIANFSHFTNDNNKIKYLLQELESDGLIKFLDGPWQVTPLGNTILGEIAFKLDAHFRRN